LELSKDLDVVVADRTSVRMDHGRVVKNILEQMWGKEWENLD
jgi:hypothetical protein